MRKTSRKIWLLCLVGLASQWALAQQPAIIVESSRYQGSAGDQPAYVVEIPQAKAKKVEGLWAKAIKEGKGAKVATANGEVTATDIQLNRIHANPLNVYSRVVETANGVKLVSAFEIDSVFFEGGQNADKDVVIRKYLSEFAVTAYNAAIDDEVKEETDVLKNLESELKSLQRDEEKLHKKIAENKNEIAKLEAELDGMNQKRGELVRTQASSLGELDGASASAIKDVNKKSKKTNKKLISLQSEIRDAERKIPEVQAAQDIAKQKIEGQKEKIKEVEAKKIR